MSKFTSGKLNLYKCPYMNGSTCTLTKPCGSCQWFTEKPIGTVNHTNLPVSFFEANFEDDVNENLN